MQTSHDDHAKDGLTEAALTEAALTEAALTEAGLTEATLTQTAFQENILREGEQIHDLMYKGLRIIQSNAAFRFGTDAVLLADFARLFSRERALDMGTGTGILALLLAARVPGARIDALEIQQSMADMAARSVALNALGDRVRVHCCDARDAHRLLGAGCFDLVVCNPPYSREGAAISSASDALAIARHEGQLRVGEMAQSAMRALRNGGRLCVVFPFPRMLELMQAMQQAQIEPKRTRLVYARVHKPPKLVLVEGIRGAQPGLMGMPPLILSDECGNPTPEYRRIYHMDM